MAMQRQERNARIVAASPQNLSAENFRARIFTAIGVERGRNESPVLHKLIARIGEIMSASAVVGFHLQHADRIRRRFGEDDFDHRRDAIDLFPIRAVAQGQQQDFHRFIRRDEKHLLQRQCRAFAGKTHIAASKNRVIMRVGPAQRQQRRGMDLAGVLFDNIDRLAGRGVAALSHAERRQAVGAGVAVEGENVAIVARHGAQPMRAGHDMGEGARRGGRRLQFTSILRKGEARQHRKNGPLERAATRECGGQSLRRQRHGKIFFYSSAPRWPRFRPSRQPM